MHFAGQECIMLKKAGCVAQREASIVSAHPGTTRDVIELSLDFHGYPLIVCDMAGLRQATDYVESIGIEKAKKTLVT